VASLALIDSDACVAPTCGILNVSDEEALETVVPTDDEKELGRL
jgi:hypothetical protein